jgi:hypothetical protein
VILHCHKAENFIRNALISRGSSVTYEEGNARKKVIRGESFSYEGQNLDHRGDSAMMVVVWVPLPLKVHDCKKVVRG